MRRSLLLAVLVVFASFAGAQVAPQPDAYSIDPVHSGASFQIRHLVGNVIGRFNEMAGTIRLDPADLTKSSVVLTIKAASIDTSNSKRDDDLRSANFFDVQKFPEIRFESVRIEKGTGDTYRVTGRLTMHGVTREVTVPVEYMGTVRDPWGNQRAGFSVSCALDRKDFGIVWNKVLDSGGLMLGDEVRATINIEAIRAKPEGAAAGK